MQTNVVTLNTTSKKPTIEVLKENDEFKTSPLMESTSSTQNVFAASSKIFDTNLFSTSLDLTLSTTQIPTTNAVKLKNISNKKLLTTSTTVIESLITTQFPIMNTENALDKNFNFIHSVKKNTPNINKLNLYQSSTISTTKLFSIIDNLTLFHNNKIGDDFESIGHFINNNLNKSNEKILNQKSNDFINETQLNIESTTKFINESNTNTNIIIKNVESLNETTWSNEINNLTTYNSTTNVQLNKKDKRWRQKSSKTFIKQNLCKQKNGIICEYGCTDKQK